MVACDFHKMAMHTRRLYWISRDTLTQIARAASSQRMAGTLAASVIGLLFPPLSHAACEEFGGFAIFQCSGSAYFEAAPAGSGTVTAAFWQIGFGNGVLNTGAGTDGTGTYAAYDPYTYTISYVFNGNDNGGFLMDVADARATIGDEAVPSGALCLRNNDWGSAGVDGCCDNYRDPSLPNGTGDDDILNPEFNVLLGPGTPSQRWKVDYPMAVLLTESTGQHFAIAAVATKGGGSDPNDVRPGFFDLKDVINGLANPITGARNVVPWQLVPEPFVNSNSPADPNDPSSPRVLDLSWDGAELYSDESVRPSSNSTLDPNLDPNRPGGVGVVDISLKFPLIRYVLEAAPESDPNFGTPSLVHETYSASALVTVDVGHCLRLRTLFGKKPSADAPTLDACRVAGCGDVGYEVISRRLCVAQDGTVSVSPGDGVGAPGGEPSGPWAAELPASPGPGEGGTAFDQSSSGAAGPSTPPAIELTLQHGAAPNEIILTWSGGTPPYNLYSGGTGDLSAGGVTVLLQDSSSTSYAGNFAGRVTLFRVGDSAAATASITNLSSGSPTTDRSTNVEGAIQGAASRVWVNKKPAQITGSNFTANNIPLALGTNPIHATVLTPDENISIATSDVTRLPNNEQPRIVIIQPSDGTDLADVTPLVLVSYSDTEGLDVGSHRAYLDGSDRTGRFGVTANLATWQLESAEHLDRGTHTLIVTIRDSRGFTQSASSQFRVSGPRLTSVTPPSGLPASSVTLRGDGFGTATDTQVLFGSQEATTMSSISSTRITVTVPPGTTDGPLRVRVSGVESNPIPFDVAFSSVGGAAESILVAVDALDRVYFSNGLGAIHRIEQDGTVSAAPFFATPYQITGLAFDPTGTTLYVATRGDPTTTVVFNGIEWTLLSGRIYSVAPSGTSSLLFYIPAGSGFSDTFQIDVRPPFVYTTALSASLQWVVLRLDMNSSTRAALFSLPLSRWAPPDLEIDQTGNAIYWVYETDDGLSTRWCPESCGKTEMAYPPGERS